MTVGSVTVGDFTPIHHPGRVLQVLGALGLAGSAVISYGLALVVQVSPWYDPQVCSDGQAGREWNTEGVQRMHWRR